MKHFQNYKNFFPEAKKLRHEFEDHFSDPRDTDSKRFVWDYWFFENQYHLVRTPAFYYFTQKLYANFHSYLVQWGRENLGCHDISPPWLSYYVDGCYQNLHSDVPHGPWAFVFSLTPMQTPNKKEFYGGETLILKPDVLNYWQGFQDSQDREYKSFVDLIPSMFNQLTVFDPRFPHGVTEVKGTRDPLKARLVIHGWFVEPRPYVVGGLSTAQVQKVLTPALEKIGGLLADLSAQHGTMSVRLHIGCDGHVKNCRFITNTVLSLSGAADETKWLNKHIQKILAELKFVRARTESHITVPILFK